MFLFAKVAFPFLGWIESLNALKNADDTEFRDDGVRIDEDLPENTPPLLR